MHLICKYTMLVYSSETQCTKINYDRYTSTYAFKWSEYLLYSWEVFSLNSLWGKLVLSCQYHKNAQKIWKIADQSWPKKVYGRLLVELM